MDIENGGKEADTGIGTIDSIDVLVPPRVKAIIDNIQQTRMAAQKEVQNKKAELKSSKPGQKGKLQSELDIRNQNLERCFDKVKESYEEEAKARKNALLDTYSDYNHMISNVNSVIFTKNQDFNLTIEDELCKFVVDGRYRYNILFLEFHSNNVTELNEVAYRPSKFPSNKALDYYHANRLCMSIDEKMEIDPIIERVDQLLEELLSKIKKENIQGDTDSRFCIWIILYFNTQFFLSDLALEKLIKFIDEVHYKIGFRFAFIFKKIEDAMIYPAGNNTQLRFTTYERKGNLLHDFLHKWFTMDQGKAFGLVMSRELVGNLLDNSEIFRKHIRGTAATILQIYKAHNALNPRKGLLEKMQDDIDERRERYMRSTKFLEKLIDLCYDDPDRQEKERNEMICYFYAGRAKNRFESLIRRLANDKMDKESMIVAFKHFRNVYKETHTVESSKLSDAAKLMEKEISELEKQIKAESENNGPGRKPGLRNTVKAKDNTERFNLLTAKQQNLESADDLSLFDNFKEKMVKSIYNFLDTTLDEYIWYIKRYSPCHLVQDYEQLVGIIEPDIQGNYMAELNQTKSLRTELSLPNPAEIATRKLFEIIAMENHKFYVSKLKVQFDAKMSQLDLKLDPDMQKHLFYFALNLLKRLGLIHEHNKVKQILHKCFFRRANVDHSAL